MPKRSLAPTEPLTLNDIRREAQKLSDPLDRFYLLVCSGGVIFWAIVYDAAYQFIKRTNFGFDHRLVAGLAVVGWMICVHGYPGFITKYVKTVRRLLMLATMVHRHYSADEPDLPRPNFWTWMFARDPGRHTQEYMDQLPALIKKRQRVRRNERRQAEREPVIASVPPPPITRETPPAPTEEEILHARLSVIDPRTLDSYIREQFEKYLAEYRAKQKEKRLKVRLYPLRKAAELLNQYEFAR